MFGKKLISAVLSLGMVMSMLAMPIAKAAELENVAKGKTLLNADGTECTATNINKLVDGDATNHTHGCGIKEVIIDLGKRYVVDSVVLDQQCGYDQVGIYGANDINADNWEKFYLGANGNSIITKDNINFKCRYIKLTSYNQEICNNELYVYADLTVTEVTRGKPATSSATWAGYEANKAVDGSNASNANAWQTSGSGYVWLQVDMETPYHIGYIEIAGRASGQSDVKTGNNFSIYGSLEEPATDTTTATVTGATKLTSMGSETFPTYDAEDPENSIYKITINDSEAYRYLMYKKDISWNAEIGEFRGFVINPTVTSVSENEGVVTVKFSDDIIPASVTDKITVTNGAAELEIENVTVNDNEVSFALVNPPSWGEVSLTVDRFVRNTSSVPMAEAYTATLLLKEGIQAGNLTFDTAAVTAGSTVTASADIESALEEPTQAALFIAVKNADGELKAIDLDEKTITVEDGQQKLTKELTVPSEWTTGWSIEAYVWNKVTLEAYADNIEIIQTANQE